MHFVLALFIAIMYPCIVYAKQIIIQKIIAIALVTMTYNRCGFELHVHVHLSPDPTLEDETTRTPVPS